MASVTVDPPKVKTKVNVRQRKNVLYQVTYELLKIFHAPHMKSIGKTLYAGLIDTQAINRVTLAYLGKGRKVEFYINFIYDWNTYEVLINTSRKDIEMDSKINSIDQFIGRKLAFEAIYKMILSTINVYSKEVMYSINPKREPELEKIVGKFCPIDDIIFDETAFVKVTYFSHELEELKVSVYIKKTNEKPSLVRKLSNKFRGM